MWRGEVGPRLRCVRPRPLRCACGPGFSFECLIFTEVGDGHAEWVDRDQFIGHLGLEKEHEVRGVQIALQLAVVGGRVIDHVEVHTRTEGWRLHLFERNFFYVDIDFGRGGIGDEFLDDVVLAVGVEDAVGELAVEEVEGLREIVLNGVAVAAVIEVAKLREEILRFGVLGLVFEVVVVDGLGAAQIVDADHQRTEVLEGANGAKVDERQRDTNDGQQRERNLEIGIRHHGITVLFEIEALGIVETLVVVHSKTLSMIPTEDAAGGAAEDVVGQRGHLEQGVDRGEKCNEEDRKPGDELHGGESARGREAQRAEHQVSNDEDHGRGDDLVEGVLDEAAEPAPEEPLHFRNDKEWDKDRPHQDADRRGNESIGDDHNRHGLGGGEQDRHDDVDGGSENVSPRRRVHAGLEVRYLRNNCLQLGLIDLAGQELRFVGDEIVEADTNTGNRRVVVVDHRKTKADGQQQAREIVEMEW